MENILNSEKALVCVDFQNDFVNGAIGFDGAEDIEDNVIDLVNTAINEKWGAVLLTADIHDADEYTDTLEGERLPIPHCLTRNNKDPEFGADIVAIDDGALFYGKLGELVSRLVNGLSETKLRFAFSKFDPRDNTPIEQIVNMHNITGVIRSLVLAGKDMGINIQLVPKNTFGAINLGTYFKIAPKLIVVCGLVTDICVLSNVVILRALFPNAIIQVKMNACSSFDAEKHQMVMQLLNSIQVDVV